MITSEINFKCDGRTSYMISSFVPKDASEIRLTNDERKHLLTIFNFRQQVYTGYFLLIGAFFAFIAGFVFWGISNITENVFGALLCFLTPAIVLLVVGIYLITTAPNIEKVVIKAYELTVTDMHHKYYVYTSEDDPKYYETEALKEITHDDAAKYGPHRTEGDKRYYLFLQLNGKWVEIVNSESYTPIRYGIKIGDKVRCAVLECGEYCYISLY